MAETPTVCNACRRGEHKHCAEKSCQCTSTGDGNYEVREPR